MLPTSLRPFGPALALVFVSACSSAPKSSAPPPTGGPVPPRDESTTTVGTPASPAMEAAPAAAPPPPPPSPPPPAAMAAPAADKGAGPTVEKKDTAKNGKAPPADGGSRRSGGMGQGAGAGMGLRPCCQALLQSAATTPAPGNQATQDAATYCQNAVAQATPSDDAVAEIRQRLGGAPLPASCR